MESESLPLLGTAPGYELRSRAGGGAHAGALDATDLAALERTERRLVRHLRGSGVLIVHDLAVPPTATTIDHLCIGPDAITSIDVERSRYGGGRAAMLEQVARETEILAAILHEAGVRSDQIRGAICRTGRELLRGRGSSDGSVAIGTPRAVARVARRARQGRPIDVQLALAVVRNSLGYEGQRSHRITRPDGF